MAALTDAILREAKHINKAELPVKAATKLLKGALIANGTDGLAVNATDAAGLRVFGIAYETVDNTGGADKDKYVIVDFDLRLAYSFSASGADETWLNQKVYVIDNNTVALAGTVNSIVAGRCIKVESATSVRVQFLTD